MKRSSIFVYLLVILAIVFPVMWYVYHSVTSLVDSKKQDANNQISYILQARQANVAFDYKLANKFYELACQADSNNVNIISEYLMFLTSQNDKKNALTLAKQLILQDREHFLANLIIISDYIAKNNLDAAIDQLQFFEGDSLSVGTSVFNALLGMKYYLEGEPDKFKEISSSTYELNPGFYHYQAALFSILVMDKERAKYHFIEANSSYVNVEAVRIYAKLLYERDQEEGIDYFIEYLSDNFLTRDLAGKYLERTPKMSIAYTLALILAELSASISDHLNPYLLVTDSSLLANVSNMTMNNDLATTLIGSFYESIGSYERAVYFYKSTNKSGFYSRIVLINVVNILKNLGRNDEALAYIQDMQFIDRNNPTYFIEQGKLYHDIAQYNKALASYKEALRISLDIDSTIGAWLTYFFRGITYDKVGKWDKAEADLLVAYSINDNDPLLLNYLAYSWINRDYQLDEAIAILDKALDISPDNPNILDSYAWGLFKKGEYDNALVYSQKAAELLPYSSIINNHLGDIWWELGNENLAVEHWNIAKNLSPDIQNMQLLEQKLNFSLPTINP